MQIARLATHPETPAQRADAPNGEIPSGEQRPTDRASADEKPPPGAAMAEQGRASSNIDGDGVGGFLAAIREKLLPMIGLGAVASYNASSGVGLPAAVAERQGAYRRGSSFARASATAEQAPPAVGMGGASDEPPARRRRRTKNAWLEPLD